MAFSTPLIAVTSATSSSAKPLPPEQSFFSLDADNLVLSALKKSDVDGTIVLRAFEIQGNSAESSVHFLGHDRTFREANLLEEDSSAGEQRNLRVNPYQIDTIKLRIQ
jgi:alpha-mannosidase